MSEKFCLKWNDFQESLLDSYKNLKDDASFADVTLVSDDQVQIPVHKFALSSCSSFFKTILLNNPHNNPLLFLNGINSTILKSIIDYIYCGEAQLYHEQLDAFLEVAHKLKIEGLLSTDNVVPDDAVSLDETIIDDTYVQEITENMDYKQQIEGLLSTNNVVPDDTVSMDENNIDDTNVQLFTDNMDSDMHIKREDRNERGRNVEKNTKTVAVVQGETNEEDLIQMKRVMIAKENGLFRCIVCQRVMKNYTNSLKHVEKHIEGLSFNCQQCEKQFRSKNSLYKHTQICHRNK